MRTVQNGRKSENVSRLRFLRCYSVEVIKGHKPMTSTAILILILLTLPLIVLLYISETEPQRVRRMYRSGRYSQQNLADRLGITRHRVRKHLAAA